MKKKILFILCFVLLFCTYENISARETQDTSTSTTSRISLGYGINIQSEDSDCTAATTGTNTGIEFICEYGDLNTTGIRLRYNKSGNITFCADIDQDISNNISLDVTKDNFKSSSGTIGCPDIINYAVLYCDNCTSDDCAYKRLCDTNSYWKNEDGTVSRDERKVYIYTYGDTDYCDHDYDDACDKCEDTSETTACNACNKYKRYGCGYIDGRDELEANPDNIKQNISGDNPSGEVPEIFENEDSGYDEEYDETYNSTPKVKAGTGLNASNCEALLGKDFSQVLRKIMDYMKYIGAALVVVFSIIDLIKTALSGKDEDMKKVGQKFIKRMAAAILLFFVVQIVEVLLQVMDIISPIDCFK